MIHQQLIIIYLEYEKEDEKLAFVGISNWTLDASKMNRGIYLAVSAPDEKDCIETAIEIANSYDDNLGNKYKDEFKLLARSYAEFVEDTILREHADFHGARDFYHVIKLTARTLLKKMKNNEDINPMNIIRNSVQRNFGGYEGSVKSFETEINSIDKSYELSSNINITELIRDSIQDPDCRYLMIISDTSRSQFLVEFLLQTINKNNSFLLGSHFDSDLKSEKYTASILQRIQVSMKNGDIVIMNNLESVYPSLYDLFNQTFTEICGRKYARITIGSSTDALFEVDNNFKCIVLVDNKKLDQQDRPFLNRFEKQVFSFENLLNEKENDITNQIYEILNHATSIDDKLKKNIKIDISQHLVNFNLEEIRAIVYNNRNKTLEDIKTEVFEQIIPTFSQDIMVNMQYSSFKTKYPEDFKKIVEIYEKKPNNLAEFIKQLEDKKMKTNKNLIFTFSRIFDGLTDNEDDFGIRIIDKNDSEKQINEFIDKFYRSNKKIMVIQLKEDLSVHLNHIQNLVDHYIKNYSQQIENTEDNTHTDTIDTTKNKEKYVIFIIHLKREVFYSFENKNKDNNYISHLSSYNQLFIDNLRGENISITQFYNLKNNELYNKDDNNEINIFDKNEEFSNLIYQGFMRFSYKFLNEYIPDEEDLKENKDFKITATNYHENATQSLKYDKKKGNKYLEDIQNRIIEIICEKKMNNIIEEIITDSDYQQKGIDFISDIRNYMKELLLKYFIKFIYKSEKDAVLPSILFPTNKNENKDEYIIDYINTLDFGDENPSYDIIYL